MKHDKIYIGLLNVFILFGIIATIFTWGILIPQAKSDYPENLAFLYFFGGITFFMTILLLSTVVLRLTEPKSGKVLTKISNIFMIVYCIPFGTLVGVYGILMVDKDIGSEGVGEGIRR